MLGWTNLFYSFTFISLELDIQLIIQSRAFSRPNRFIGIDFRIFHQSFGIPLLLKIGALKGRALRKQLIVDILSVALGRFA